MGQETPVRWGHVPRRSLGWEGQEETKAAAEKAGEPFAWTELLTLESKPSQQLPQALGAFHF